MIQGVVLVAAAGYVIVNLTVDVLYSLINPRIRIAGRARDERPAGLAASELRARSCIPRRRILRFGSSAGRSRS